MVKNFQAGSSTCKLQPWRIYNKTEYTTHNAHDFTVQSFSEIMLVWKVSWLAIKACPQRATRLFVIATPCVISNQFTHSFLLAGSFLPTNSGLLHRQSVHLELELSRCKTRQVSAEEEWNTTKPILWQSITVLTRLKLLLSVCLIRLL